MVTVSVGTDTYGRVKTVASTSIVTKFVMLQFLPVYPLQSYYFVGAGRSRTSGIPSLVNSRFAAVQGIPLASVDRTSVLMAYVRALFAALTLVGSMALIPGIMYLTGEPLDDLGRMMTRGLLVALVVGVVGGILTYAIPLTPRRERDIRRFCAEHLGVSADPARVTPDLSKILVKSVGHGPVASEKSRDPWIRQLIVTRAKIPQATDMDELEARTDLLLDELRHAERLFA